MKKRNALVAIGSNNGERPFGLTSGHRVADALRQRGWTITVEDAALPGRIFDALRVRDRFDAVVPVGFGTGVEDGTIYLIASMVEIPCAGPSPAVGAITLDKCLFGKIVTGLYRPESGVRVPAGTQVLRSQTPEQVKNSIQLLTPPLIVKPNFGGSSIALVLAKSHHEAVAAALALKEAEGRVLVQELIWPSREVSITILDGPEGPNVLPIVELRRECVFGYEEKFGVNAEQRHVIPAPIEPGLRRKLEDACLTVHSAIGACGLTRYDVLIDQQELVFLEANSIPGLLPSSIACDAARAAGISFPELAEYYAMSAFLPRSEPKFFIDNGEDQTGEGL